MTDQLIVLEVLGLPEAQGSFIAFLGKHDHRPHLKPTNEPALKKWRKRVAEAAAGSMHHVDMLTCPVKVQCVFAFNRPSHHYRTGRFSHLLRDDAPRFPDNRGTKDIDKLQRALLDALTEAHVWADDSQVCHIIARKVWAGESVHAPDEPGMRVQIEPAYATEGVLL